MIYAVFGLTIVFGLFAFWQVSWLLKKKMWKELWLSCLLLAVGYVLAVVQAMQVTVPNPLDALMYIYSPVSKWFAP